MDICFITINITMNICMHEVDLIMIFHYIHTCKWFAPLPYSQLFFSLRFLTNVSSMCLTLVMNWRAYYYKGCTKQTCKLPLFLENTIIIQYIMFNMLNKTLMHLFNAEIIFNTFTKSNFLQDFTIDTVPSVSCQRYGMQSRG